MQVVTDQAISETLGSTVSGVTALQTTALIRKLDQICRQFINAAHTKHHFGAWSWMQDVTNFQTLDETSLSAQITTASTSFTVGSSSFLTSTGGRVWIKTSRQALDFVDYASASGATASTVTDIDMTHDAAEQVGKCYALPSDYAKARKLVINSVPYEYRQQDLLPFYRTYYTRGAFIVLPEGSGNQDATLWYEKSPTDISTGVDATDLARTIEIPEDFMWYAIHMLKAYIQRNRRKRNDALESEQLAEMELEKALNYDVSRTTPTGMFTDY